MLFPACVHSSRPITRNSNMIVWQGKIRHENKQGQPTGKENNNIRFAPISSLIMNIRIFIIRFHELSHKIPQKLLRETIAKIQLNEPLFF